MEEHLFLHCRIRSLPDYLMDLFNGEPYRFKVDYFCGNFRAQVLMIYGASGTHPADTLYYGCKSTAAPTGICTESNIDDCWCTIVEGPIAGIDPAPLDRPGMAGIYSSGGYAGMCSVNMSRPVYDNFKASAFAGDCGVVCGPWSGWSTARTDQVPFKYLYEGGLFDFSAGRNVSPSSSMGKIDVNTEPPAYDATYNHSLDSNPYCNGWNLLENLPTPTGSSNLDTIRAFLEPMHSAVKYQKDGAGAFAWVEDFDNDSETSGTYNPIPMVADGTTPINSSLLEAFDWYVEQRTVGDWATDPYEGCRQWYVILITDGEEGCEFEADGTLNPDRVCEDGQAASKFADPGIEGVDPLPVYTIGFSESIAENSALECIAEDTGGLFLQAENASQLSEALYEVFYRLEGESRAFTPFKVSPPPSSEGGNMTRDYLAVFPFFQPQEGQSLWAGDLYAFPLNRDNPLLPTVDDCQLDESGLIWSAAAALQDQIDEHTEGNPKRFVYMGSDSTASWVRHDLKTIPTDATLRTELQGLLNPTGTISDVITQQVVNFVRNIYMDSDVDPSNAGPPGDARPSGYPVLGEIYHSQPVVVNPPNRPMFFFDYGLAKAGESGAHDYPDFMEEKAKRRRIALVGANDGMLHAFDAGVWDRDRVTTDVASDTYNEIHDLGDGTELFAYVPQAVMGSLYDITSGGSIEHTQPLYMVDGPIVTSDAFIDYDGDTNREWRTVALSSMRRGGRGIVALDITQPDPVDYSPGADPNYVPQSSDFPGCHDGTDSRCEGEYPKILWEFSDTSDSDTNCPMGLTGTDCAPYWDLGWTWSTPAIARIAVYNSSEETEPDDVFVAFFGGGWDKNNSDSTGNFFYGVDLATGAVLLKVAMGVDVPGGVSALDSDTDGFHDRIYFADSNGSVWRLEYPEPTDSAATGVTAGTLTRIFDFRSTAADGGFTDRQEFFTKPVPVATSFDGSGYVWALALGSGNRADLANETSGVDHFYFLMDAGDTTTRGKSNLMAVGYGDLNGSFDCSSSALVPPYYGWYLSLRDTEKVNFDATVLDGYVRFPTFDPSTETATHNVPDQCGGTPDPEEPPVELSLVCRASGLSRTYELWYECGLGEYSEHNDIVTGSEDYTIDGQTYHVFTNSAPFDNPPGVGGAIDGGRTHTVTNWRQE